MKQKMNDIYRHSMTLTNAHPLLSSFLSSDANNICGQIIAVDVGWTLN